MAKSKKSVPRFTLLVSDGEVYFSKKKSSATKYFALSLGKEIPSPKMFVLYSKLVLSQWKEQ